MVKRIEDVVPQHRNLASVDSSVLIATLYIRGVTIRDIFGRYYEFDEQSSQATLTVEDAELAGYGYIPGQDLTSGIYEMEE